VCACVSGFTPLLTFLVLCNYNNNIYILIPHIRSLLWEANSRLASQEIPGCHETWRYTTVGQTSTLQVPLLSQTKPSHALTPNLVILPSTTLSSKWSLSYRFHFSTTRYVTRRSHPPLSRELLWDTIRVTTGNRPPIHVLQWFASGNDLEGSSRKPRCNIIPVCT
jgi:hypothetical protein